MLRLHGQCRNTLEATAYSTRTTVPGTWDAAVYRFLVELVRMVWLLKETLGSRLVKYISHIKNRAV